MAGLLFKANFIKAFPMLYFQVMFMIAVTWVVPAILFFVSIFGWEHFVGKRDLLPGECMVQFLKDPVFNTSLIVGYYWIPLTILIVLYAQIFHSAWTLSKKAADKERERQKLLQALAKKPGSDGTPTPQINKKATNTALGIAAVAMTSSFATGGNPPDASVSNEAKQQSSSNGTTEESKKVVESNLNQLPCTCNDEATEVIEEATENIVETRGKATVVSSNDVKGKNHHRKLESSLIEN